VKDGAVFLCFLLCVVGLILFGIISEVNKYRHCQCEEYEIITGVKTTMEEKYIVCFKSIATGFTGNGQPISRKLAEAWVKDANKKYGNELSHWIELAPNGLR